MNLRVAWVEDRGLERVVDLRHSEVVRTKKRVED